MIILSKGACMPLFLWCPKAGKADLSRYKSGEGYSGWGATGRGRKRLLGEPAVSHFLDPGAGVQLCVC